MDNETKESIDAFVQYLTTEFQKHKDYKLVQLEKWSLKDFRVSIKFFFQDKIDNLYFDVREIKENRARFDHLLPNAMAQLKEKLPSFS